MACKVIFTLYGQILVAFDRQRYSWTEADREGEKGNTDRDTGGQRQTQGEKGNTDIEI